MSLQPQPLAPVPAETVRVAQAAFPHGCFALHLRDHLGLLYADPTFADLFPRRGQPALSPAQLALVTILQFREGLADRAAAEAVQARIDWKYALGLELTDPGFHYSVLAEFRARLLAGAAEERLLTSLLDLCKERGWVRARGTQRTDATHVLGVLRVLNRLELVGEAVRAALNALAVAAPGWLQEQVDPQWGKRYAHRVEEYRLPGAAAARTALAVQIGHDGQQLLTAVYALTAPEWLRHLPTVQALRAIWVQQYHQHDEQLFWREEQDMPPSAQRINTPYEVEARYARKRDTTWTGYKAHLTESCDPDQPHLITHVATTAATSWDGHVVEQIHQDLARHALLPADHVVDSGYVEAGQLVQSQQEYGVNLLGPVHPDTHAQAQSGQGYGVQCFVIDWEAAQVRCPAGQVSQGWRTETDKAGRQTIGVRWGRAACGPCPLRSACTRAVKGVRQLTLRPQAEHQALQAARARQTTAEFQAQYAQRAGIEGTISSGVRRYELRQSRYRGRAKTHLQEVIMAVVLNLVRLVAWWQGVPRAQSRLSPFAALVS